MSSQSNILANLNDAQRRAVTGPSEHTLVIAGAGTGKTTVLTKRVAWMVAEKGVPPNRILVTTFTNKAAAEMRERIEGFLGGEVEGMWMGTFHSLCSRMLRMHSDLAGLPRNWFVMDSDDQLKTMKRIVTRENGIHEGHGLSPKEVVEHVNSLKDKGERPPIGAMNAMRAYYGSDDATNAPDVNVPNGNYMDLAAADYQVYCDKIGAVDFGELLVRTKELLSANDALRERYRNRFRHVLVDEFQDTNKVQYDLFMQFAGEKNKLWAVGDDDQSIYAWRGAEPSNMFKFRKFADDKVVKLEHNYRSTEHILKAANAVIKHNTTRLAEKNLFCEQGMGDKIEVVEDQDVYDESQSVAASAVRWISEGRSPTEVAVLYRTSAQSRLIEQSLASHGIKCVIKGGHKFFEREEVRDAVAYIRLLREENDDVAFTRVFNKPPRRLGGKAFDAVAAVANEQKTSLWEATEQVAGDVTTGNAMRTHLNGFLTLIQGMRENMDEMSVAEVAEMVVKNTGLIEYHGAKGSEQAASKVENLRELVQACGEYGSVSSFLDETTLNADEREDDAPAVQLMTIHSAKGLEFPLVVMAGMDSMVFPHPRSENLEEERRLAYVGITRAREKLVMTWPANRAFAPGQSPQSTERSMFIDEIPEEHLNVIRRETQQTHTRRQNRSRSSNRRRTNYRSQNRSQRPSHHYGGRGRW